MTADEMFKEYNYKKICDDRTEISYEKYVDGGDEYINFYLKDRLVSKQNCFDAGDISMGELRAIEQKCRELGWLE